jgi:hypothetical protein
MKEVRLKKISKSRYIFLTIPLLIIGVLIIIVFADTDYDFDILFKIAFLISGIIPMIILLIGFFNSRKFIKSLDSQFYCKRIFDKNHINVSRNTVNLIRWTEGIVGLLGFVGLIIPLITMILKII